MTSGTTTTGDDMKITEFLEARIAEDERHANKLAETDRRPILSISATINHPQRLLAEVAAKRAILSLHENYIDEFSGPIGECVICEPGGWEHMTPTPESVYPCKTIKALATVYADHPDYDASWAL